jgi:hypothetical protein
MVLTNPPEQKEQRFAMTDNLSLNAIDPVNLWEKLDEFFSEEDIRDVCFQLEVDFENLPGKEKKGKARELVIYCRNRAMLEKRSRSGSVWSNRSWDGQ